MPWIEALEATRKGPQVRHLLGTVGSRGDAFDDVRVGLDRLTLDAGAAAHVVDGLSPGYDRQPGRGSAQGRVEPFTASPDLHEDVLQDVLGSAAVTADAQGDSGKPAGGAVVKCPERPRIPVRYGEEQGLQVHQVAH
jgi:hypothetical protein